MHVNMLVWQKSYKIKLPVLKLDQHTQVKHLGIKSLLHVETLVEKLLFYVDFFKSTQIGQTLFLKEGEEIWRLSSFYRWTV